MVSLAALICQMVKAVTLSVICQMVLMSVTCQLVKPVAGHRYGNLQTRLGAVNTLTPLKHSMRRVTGLTIRHIRSTLKQSDSYCNC